MYAVNQCYEDGLYFSDYMAFCADAPTRIPPPGAGRRAGRSSPGSPPPA